MNKIFSSLILLMALSHLAFSQVTGIVTDAQDNTPIIGASVLIKGTGAGTSTDQNGAFSINAQKGDVIEVRFIGYQAEVITLGDQTELKIQLKEDQVTLNEVVVTALGISRQSKSLGYVVQSVDSKQVTTSQDPNLVNNLTGKVAGVTITNGGAGVGSTSRIVIRGVNSFSSSSQPLFVVDGVPINNETVFNNSVNNSSNAGTWAEVDWGNGAAEFNASDIDKINVLKGAAAAALYGTRAASGAIVITTKKSDSEKGKFNFNYTTNNMVNTPLIMPRIQGSYGAGNGNTPYQYVDGTQSYENNIPNYGPPLDGRNIVQFDSPVLDASGNATGLQAADLVARSAIPGNTVQATPWVAHPDNFKNFLQTGFTSINNLSVSTNTDNGSYRVSFGNLSNKGIAPNTDLYRYQLSLRAETKLSDKLTANYYVGYINSGSKNRPNIGYGSESVMYTFFGVYGMPENINLASLRDKWWQSGQEGYKQFRYWANHDNPYVTMFENTNSFAKNRLISNASLKYQFNSHWNLMARTGIDSYSEHRESHRVFSSVRFPNGGFRTDDVTYFENNTDFLLSYARNSTTDWNFNASVGGNRFQQKTYYLRNIASDLISPGLYNFSNARTLLPPLETKTEKEIYSLYAFADLSYQNWVFLNVTARNDVTSTLPSGKNSFLYPSASLSAVISDKIELPRYISYLKLRASTAQVGRDANPYSINNTFVTNTPFGSNPLTTGNSVLANNNLKPSTTTMQEYGVDVRFLDGRVGVDVAVYNSDTQNEIVQLPLPISSGYTNAFVNGGSINNKGVEVILSGSPLRSTRGLNWDMTFNFSHNYGTVTALPAGVDSYKYFEVTQYDRYFRSIQYNAVVGEKLGNMYGNVFVRDANGNIVYNNGIPQVTNQNTRHLLGNYNPDFILGWTNNLTYGNLNLAMTWDWRQGGVFYSYTKLGLLQNGMSVDTQYRPASGIVGAGVKTDGSPNDVSVSPANYYLNYYNPNNNEVFTYDASYIKLREVRLGYTFHGILANHPKSSLSLNLIGRNLLLFTKNGDVDPENLALRGNQILPGIEYNSFPSQRSYGFSLSLNY